MSKANNSRPHKRIADWLKSRREQLKLSQQDLADKTGAPHRHYISRLESGKIDPRATKFFSNLMLTLNASPAEIAQLMGYSQADTPELTHEVLAERFGHTVIPVYTGADPDFDAPSGEKMLVGKIHRWDKLAGYRPNNQRMRSIVTGQNVAIIALGAAAEEGDAILFRPRTGEGVILANFVARAGQKYLLQVDDGERPVSLTGEVLGVVVGKYTLNTGWNLGYAQSSQ